MTEPRDARDSEMLPETPSVTVAKVGPDDVIVMEYGGVISQSSAERITRQVEDAWPGRKVIVLGDGLKLKIARESDLVPRCDACQWWGRDVNGEPRGLVYGNSTCDNLNRRFQSGEGQQFLVWTAPDFGCVQFTAKDGKA